MLKTVQIAFNAMCQTGILKYTGGGDYEFTTDFNNHVRKKCGVDLLSFYGDKIPFNVRYNMLDHVSACKMFYPFDHASHTIRFIDTKYAYESLYLQPIDSDFVSEAKFNKYFVDFITYLSTFRNHEFHFTDVLEIISSLSNNNTMSNNNNINDTIENTSLNTGLNTMNILNNTINNTTTNAGANTMSIFGNININLRPASITINGDLAFKTADGTYRCVNSEGEFIEVPTELLIIRDANILMPQFKTEPVAGDVLIEGTKIYIMKDDDTAFDLETGITAKKSVAKNMFFKQAIVYRSMLKDLDVASIMPLMLMNGGNLSNVMPLMLMGQMTGNSCDMSALTSNPLMMMAMLNGQNTNSMMPLMLMSMMQNNKSSNQDKSKKNK